MISLLNYLFLYFVCVLVYYLVFIYFIYYLTLSVLELSLSKIPSKISWFLFSFFLLLLFICHFLSSVVFSWMNMENIWFLCYTYNYKICLVVQFNSFVLKIMHMAMILMLIFCLRRDFGYFVVLKISVILKEKIAFNFPSIFSWFFSYLFSVCGIFDLVFFVTIAILVWRFLFPVLAKRSCSFLFI